MKWITREKVMGERVACPWLIKKFIDPEAEFIFTPADQLPSRARELDATPFDMDGEDCPFSTLLKKHQLADPAVMLLGEIVRAADSHPAKPHPAGEGLRWVTCGFSALGLSDQEILQRQFMVYDALYAECRRRAAYAGYF